MKQFISKNKLSINKNQYKIIKQKLCAEEEWRSGEKGEERWSLKCGLEGGQRSESCGEGSGGKGAEIFFFSTR